MVSISAFQADGGGSSPLTCSTTEWSIYILRLYVAEVPTVSIVGKELVLLKPRLTPRVSNTTGQIAHLARESREVKRG